MGEYIRPFRARHTKFIQLSKRFKRNANGVWDSDIILESNKPRDGANGKYQLAWDIDRLNHPIRDDTLNSKTCTRNIHYPPGCIFTYNNEEYVVVDDLYSMYQHRTITEAGPNHGLTEMQVRIKEVFPGYNFQEFPTEWADLDGIGEKLDHIKRTFRELIEFRQQYRVAIRLSNRDDGQPNIRLVSVAAKNYAQSIKNTILVATGATLLMDYYQCDFGAPELQMLGQGMMAMASVENENMYFPALTGLAANFAVTTNLGSASQPQQFAGLVAAVSATAGMYRFVIPRAEQMLDDRRLHHYLRQGWGLLIPMELRRVQVGDIMMWGGKLWCPLTGRMHEFNGRPWIDRRVQVPRDGAAYHNEYNDANAQGRRPPVSLYRNNSLNRRLSNEIEDAFELYQPEHSQDLHMTFSYWTKQGRDWNKIVDSTWVYSPTPHSKNLFFIRVPA